MNIVVLCVQRVRIGDSFLRRDRLAFLFLISISLIQLKVSLVQIRLGEPCFRLPGGRFWSGEFISIRGFIIFLKKEKIFIYMYMCVHLCACHT